MTRHPLPASGIVPTAPAAARHNEPHGRHPGVHPQLGRPAAPRPRRVTALAAAPPGPGHQPRRVRLRHRDPPRRRADPAVPAALRRLSPLLRVRDLLRRPGHAKEDAVLLTGVTGGHTPQEALDTACTVHLAGLGHEPPQDLRRRPRLKFSDRGVAQFLAASAQRGFAAPATPPGQREPYTAAPSTGTD